MASNADLPRYFGAVHPRYRVPHRAELGVGILVAITVALVDLRSAIGFSAFTVLAYYAVANASVLTLDSTERRWPRWIAVTGLIGCVTLAFTLPIASVIAGSIVLAAGAIVFLIR